LQQQNVKTKAATKYTVKVLSDFMLEKNYDGEIGTMDIVVLNGILQDFYANVRTSSGDYYSKSSLVAIRQGIRRYLQEPPCVSSVSPELSSGTNCWTFITLYNYKFIIFTCWWTFII
jgi:hypothetical protein